MTSSITYGAQSAGGTINVQSSTSISASSYGVYSTSGTVAISGSSSVTSTGSYGAYVNGGKVTVSDSSTTVSSSTSYGIYLYSSSSTATVTSATVKSSSSSSYGAYVAAGTLTLSGATIEGGYGARVAGGTLAYTGSSATKITGNNNYGLYVSSGSVTLNNATVKGSSYGAYVSGGSCTISGGSVSGDYGVYASSGTVTLNSSCSVSGSTSTNTSSPYAAVWEAGGTINLNSCTLSGYCGVRCSSGSISVTSSCSFGACTYGAYSTGGTMTLTGASIGTSVSYGAYAEGGTINVQSSASISASSYGAYATSGEIYIDGSYVYGYTAGVRSDGSSARIYCGNSTNSEIEGYTYGGYVANSGSLYVSGGTVKGRIGVYAAAGTVDVSGNATVTGSNTYGVQIADSSASVTLTNATLKGTSYGIYMNYAGKLTVSGGSVSGDYGIYASAGTVTVNSSASITGSSYHGIQFGGTTLTVSGSSSVKGDSGSSDYGLYVSSGTVTVTGGSIEGGTAVYATGGSATIQSSCALTADYSAGSAAYANGSNASISITSCTLIGYYGARSGNGTATLSSCTIQSAYYGAYASGGTINLTGCTMTSSITYGAYASGNGVTSSGYAHTVTVTLSGMSAYSSAMIMVAYTSSSSTKVTSMSTLLENLYDCYGSGSIGDASLMFMANGGYIMASSARCSSSSELVFTGTSGETITITSTQVTVSGSAYTNGTFSCSYSVSDSVASAQTFSGGTVNIQSSTKITASRYTVHVDGGKVDISGSSVSMTSTSSGWGPVCVDSGTYSDCSSLSLSTSIGNPVIVNDGRANLYGTYTGGGYWSAVCVFGGTCYLYGSVSMSSASDIAAVTVGNGLLFMEGTVENSYGVGIDSYFGSYAQISIRGDVTSRSSYAVRLQYYAGCDIQSGTVKSTTTYGVYINCLDPSCGIDEFSGGTIQGKTGGIYLVAGQVYAYYGSSATIQVDNTSGYGIYIPSSAKGTYSIRLHLYQIYFTGGAYTVYNAGGDRTSFAGVDWFYVYWNGAESNSKGMYGMT